MNHADAALRLAQLARELEEIAWALLAPPAPAEFRKERRKEQQSRCEEAILAAIAGGPRTAKQIAARTGYRYGSRLRSVCADMNRRGLLGRVPEGYYRMEAQPHGPDGYKLPQESNPVAPARPANGVNGTSGH